MPFFSGAKAFIKDAAEKVIELVDDGEAVDESELLFLHGVLHVHIISAEDLPDTDTTFFNIDGKDVTDPYVVGELGRARLFKTRYIPNELNPNWDEKFNVLVCHNANTLRISVKDKEHVGSKWIASCDISCQDLIDGQTVEGWFDLMNGEETQGKINMSVSYTPKEDLAEEESLVVPNSYFPARENCRVVLYQDAHTPQLPVFDNVVAADGSPYQATTAWKDLFKLLKEATKFIYITGWSVFTEIALVRDEDDPDGESNVGELLKRKADEGVKVLVMVWNEKLSTSKSAGLMGTHDEETRQYFEGTAVNCKTIGRCKQQDSRLASEFAATCYTHHQKTIIADAPLEDGDEDPDAPRRVVAFIGGLDITDGRYDTPEFPLWKTINTTHKGDFYSKCVKGITPESGPRQPWHDCHAKVEGRIAVDIMQNFNERWRRQAGDDVGTLVHLSEDEYQLDAIPPVPEFEGGLWNTQLFRSITSDSCIFDFERQNTLHSKYGKLVENSIMRTTVLRIRNSKNFIYLENQYFLGSAYAWYGDSSTLTMHIVPREITQKIVEKIAAGEDFKVYAVIPMFPEGIPTDAAIQEILYWQWRTFETMYKRIAKAIEDHGVDAHPTDYLNFYCLGKREAVEEMPEGEFETPEEEVAPEVVAVHNSRRHPIYVHSKMTLFDDEYVLVGSANVNQRSLGGNRDSEIAVGAFQEEHTVEAEGDPRGDVHVYRMALWAAHLGGSDEAYGNPGSAECLEKVREVTSAAWEAYTADEPSNVECHMLPYPVKVEADGAVIPLDEPFNCFPDTTANVLGKKSGYLPGKLTT